MPSLYQIDAAILQVIEAGFYVDEETGEIFEPADLEALEADRNAKLESVACFIKNLEADAQALKVEAQALTERKAAKERKAERLREYLANSLQQAGQAKFETARCALSFRKSEAVEITDEAVLPEQFRTIKQTETINKAAIKKAIKGGEQVQGAALVSRQNLQIK